MCGICIIDLACCCILFLSVHFSLVEYSVFIHTHTHIHTRPTCIRTMLNFIQFAISIVKRIRNRQPKLMGFIWAAVVVMLPLRDNSFVTTYTQYKCKCKYKHINSNTIIKKRQRISTRKMVLSMTAQAIYINGLFFSSFFSIRYAIFIKIIKQSKCVKVSTRINRVEHNFN